MLWKNKNDDGLLRVFADRLLFSKSYAINKRDIESWATTNVETRIDEFINHITIDFYKEVIGSKGPVETLYYYAHKNWWDMLVDQWAPEWFRHFVYEPRWREVKVGDVQTWNVCPHSNQDFSSSVARHLSWIVPREELMRSSHNA